MSTNLLRIIPHVPNVSSSSRIPVGSIPVVKADIYDFAYLYSRLCQESHDILRHFNKNATKGNKLGTSKVTPQLLRANEIFAECFDASGKLTSEGLASTKGMLKCWMSAKISNMQKIPINKITIGKFLSVVICQLEKIKHPQNTEKLV
jgi:hypothetical protein